MPVRNVNPMTPGPPRGCPRAFEAIREKAREKWGHADITTAAILEWVRGGCPDENGVLLKPATKQPPIAGQGSMEPQRFVEQLLEYQVFVPLNPTKDG